MSSFLGIPILRLVIILSLSCFFKLIFSQRVRDKLTPWVFAFMMIHGNILPFLSGGAHFLWMCVYFLAMAFLLNGCPFNDFRRNPVMTAFLVFWGYLTLTSFWCENAYFGFTWWLNTFVELLLVGYSVGLWILRTPDGMVRLLKPAVIVGTLGYVCYFKYGFASTEYIAESLGGRAGFDSNLLDQDFGYNVNDIGLSIAPMVAMMIIFLMEKFPKVPSTRVWRTLATVNLIVSSYLLIRTGSRNACLIFLPCVYYMFKGGDRIKIVGRLKMLVLAGAGMFLIIGVFMKEAAYIRAFTYRNSDGTVNMNDMTSGRWGEYEYFISTMTTVDKIIGQGVEIKKSINAPTTAGGCLSIYVTLFRFSGIVGCFLLALYFLMTCISARKLGTRGQIAFLLFAIWALTGLGEGAGIRRGQTLRLTQGMSLAFFSQLVPRRRDDWHVPASFDYYRGGWM